MEPNINTPIRRCIECLLEIAYNTPSPFVVCEDCQRQASRLKIEAKTYQYRKNESSTVMTGRREEILRKIAQGRLDDSIEIYGLKNGNWQWNGLRHHDDFAEIFLTGTSGHEQVHEMRQQRKDNIQQVRSAKRRSVLSGIVLSATLLTTAWFGYQKGWFVVEVDPFTVSQGDDVSAPEDLLSVLQQGSHGSVQQADFWTMDVAEVDQLKQKLWSDLAKNPRQGRELLMWLQTLLLRPDGHDFMNEGLFPPSWLGFALSLEHPVEMGHRVRAIWRAVQGDPVTMAEELKQCASDRWCQAMQAALNQDWTANLEGPGLVLLSQYALHIESVDTWEALAQRLISANEGGLGYVMQAESAIQNGHESQLQDALSKSPDWLAVDLWRMRVNNSKPPETIEQTRQRSDWAEADPRIQGVWALEQSARWLGVGGAESLKQIEAWMAGGDWLEGDFPGMMLTDRFALVHAQALLQTGERDSAIQVLTGIQRSFEDDLLNLWLGLLWVQAEDLRNASAVSERLPQEGSHYWLLQVFISVQSQNTKLIEQSLSRVVYTDVGALKVRRIHETWVPQFNWNPLLTQAEMLLTQGNLSVEYVEIIKWLAGEPVTFRGMSDGWAPGWAAKTQYALEKQQFNRAFDAANRLRRLAPSEACGEILSQIVNIKVGRPDIAQRELKLFAQKERSHVWHRWLYQSFAELEDVEMAETYRAKWYPNVQTRNISVNMKTMWDDLSND